ncbi:MAG: hypothetical protein C6H99_01195 [Epsilonproteobacteria bacterium]|nr:hypothetical protein [Campylobacterota bacterium]NPA63588.1 hypothetical protein [Campylobacterota bacterium]
MRKVTIKIEGKEYEINLDDSFAIYMKDEFEKLFPKNGSSTIKDLLSAYLKKSYDCYLMEKKLDNIIKKI